MSIKFSDLIIELTEVWLMWMAKNKLSHDPAVSFKLRRAYARECEELIDHEYKVVEKLDRFFGDG